MNGGLRLHVVGSSPAMPRAGGACSCYLVRSPSAAVLLDLGSGAAGKLQCAADYRTLDAIVISHMHPDHFFDLVALRHGLKYSQAGSAKMPLWLPPGGSEILSALSALISEGGRRTFFEDTYLIHEYEPVVPLLVGDLRITFARTQHYIAGYAIRVEREGARIVYSADTAPCDAVVELARNADLFLCEAALGLDTEGGERGHSSVEEAGQMAHRAAVNGLVLTHYPAKVSTGDLVDGAHKHFSGSVELAEDGKEFNV